MRKRSLIICVVVLSAVVCLSFCACKGTPNNENIPVTDWSDYLYNVAAAIDSQFLKVDTKEAVPCDLGLVSIFLCRRFAVLAVLRRRVGAIRAQQF